MSYRSCSPGTSSTSTSATASPPAGGVAGDLLIACVFADAGSTITGPTGGLWTVYDQQTANGLLVSLWTATRPSSPPASWTWTISPAVTVLSWVMITEHLSSFGINDHAFQFYGASGTAPTLTLPSVDPGGPGASSSFGIVTGAGAGLGVPASMTGSCQAGGTLREAHETRSAAGATGTRSVTTSGTIASAALVAFGVPTSAPVLTGWSVGSLKIGGS